MATPSTKTDDRRPTVTTDDLDRLNLSQALRDFEVANARVIDLAARLTEVHARLAETQHELSLTRVHVGNLEFLLREQQGIGRRAADAEAALATVQRSRSFRAAVMMSKTARRILK